MCVYCKMMGKDRLIFQRLNIMTGYNLVYNEDGSPHQNCRAFRKQLKEHKKVVQSNTKLEMFR